MSDSTWLTCPLCGFQFAADGHNACQACPLQAGCELVCCPRCGYQLVDTGRSILARLAASLFRPGRRGSPKTETTGQSIYSSAEHTLADVPPGWQAEVVGFKDSLPPGRRAQLQSYGILPDYSLRVVQHSPVTVINLDHTELALEPALAVGIQVKNIRKGDVSHEDRK